MWKEGTVNNVISYYFTKANAKSKRNSSTVGIENLICSFNADSLREIYFKVTPKNKKFNPLDNRELFMVEDNARIFWNLYMLLVFYKICEIAPVNECSFFEHFHNVINLVLIAGMRMFVQCELPCSYGEVYQELQGIKPMLIKLLEQGTLYQKLDEFYTNQLRKYVFFDDIEQLKDITLNKHEQMIVDEMLEYDDIDINTFAHLWEEIDYTSQFKYSTKKILYHTIGQYYKELYEKFGIDSRHAGPELDLSPVDDFLDKTYHIIN